MTVPPRSFPMTRFTHHTVAVYLPFGAGPFFVVFLCGSFIFNIQQLEYHFLFAPAEALNVTTQLVSKAKDPIFLIFHSFQYQSSVASITLAIHRSAKVTAFR